MKHKDDKGLCELAMKNSSWTWSQLRDARNLKSKIGEESITDFIVLNFKRWEAKWGAGKFTIKTFTKPKEGLNGADWEWWFIGTSGRCLGMRVQAKVLDIVSEKFEHLHYKSESGYQTDLLIDDAKKNKMIPLYCMYSNWDKNKYTPYWTCGSYRHTVQYYGNSILSPFLVKRKLLPHNEKRLSKIVGYLKPMHCIFCCEIFAKNERINKPNFPQRAFHYLKSNNFTYDSEKNFLREDVPAYVKQIIADKVESIDYPDARLKRVTIFKEIDKE